MSVWKNLRGSIGGAVAQGARRVADTVEKRIQNVGPVSLGSNGVSMGQIRPAWQNKSDPQPAGRVKALFDDPMNLMGAFGFKDRPTSISYNMMRDVLYRLPIVSNIVQLRVEQVASFGHVAPDRYSMGFRIKMREKAQVPTDIERDMCHRFERFFLRTGFGDDWMGRDSFEAYLRKITRDSLTFDQNCTELVPGNNGAPCEFYAVDAANIRIAQHLKRHTSDELEDATAYVELYNETIRARFTADEMIFGVRNPSSDIRLQGYGTSEIEYLMPTLTQMIYALDYNGAVFTNGTLARGILNIRDEELTDQDLNQIQRQWTNMCKGVQNAWSTPVIAAKDGIDWINLQGATDTQFASWIDWLTKVICAAYKVAPEEINLIYGQIGQSSSLSEQNNRDKITESKERGLRPLLRHISGNVNRYILWPNHPDLEFEFVGLDAMTPEERSDFNAKRLRSYLTLNEIRAEEDLKPLPGGDIVMDSTYLQSRQAAEQAQAGDAAGLPGMDALPEDDAQPSAAASDVPDAAPGDAQDENTAPVDGGGGDAAPMLGGIALTRPDQTDTRKSQVVSHSRLDIQL